MNTPHHLGTFEGHRARRARIATNVFHISATVLILSLGVMSCTIIHSVMVAQIARVAAIQ